MTPKLKETVNRYFVRQLPEDLTQFLTVHIDPETETKAVMSYCTFTISLQFEPGHDFTIVICLSGSITIYHGLHRKRGQITLLKIFILAMTFGSTCMTSIVISRSYGLEKFRRNIVRIRSFLKYGSPFEPVLMAGPKPLLTEISYL